jgi:hypothetical protein
MHKLKGRRRAPGGKREETMQNKTALIARTAMLTTHHGWIV